MFDAGDKFVETVHTAGEKKRFTVVLTVSAAGHKFPALIIWKGLKLLPKVVVPSNVRHAVSKCTLYSVMSDARKARRQSDTPSLPVTTPTLLLSYCCLDNLTPSARVVMLVTAGSMQRKVMRLYIDKIISKRARGDVFAVAEPVLLLLDMYGTHKLAEVRAQFKSEEIKLGFIPGGTTSVLQPLDVGVNSSFKVCQMSSSRNLDRGVLSASCVSFFQRRTTKPTVIYPHNTRTLIAPYNTTERTLCFSTFSESLV